MEKDKATVIANVTPTDTAHDNDDNILVTNQN